MSELKQARHFSQPKLTPAAVELKSASYYHDDNFVSTPAAEPAKPVKTNRWWWRLSAVTLLTIVVLSVWQWGVMLQHSWQQSVLQGGLLSLVTVAVLVLLTSLVWREVKLWRRLARNRHWQQSAQRIRHSVQFGEAQKNLKKKFNKYYQFGFTGTPIFQEN